MSQRLVKVSDRRRTYSEVIDDDEGEFELGDPIPPFRASEISSFNGKHFIFGWWECFLQSDDVPMWIREADDLLLSVELYES